MRNCPEESRPDWSVRLRRSPEGCARDCSQRSPKFLFAGISCEGKLHTSVGSLVDAEYVIGKRGEKFIFSGCMFAAKECLEKYELGQVALRLCNNANII